MEDCLYYHLDLTSYGEDELFENETTFWKWMHILKMKAYFEPLQCYSSLLLSWLDVIWRGWAVTTPYCYYSLLLPLLTVTTSYCYHSLLLPLLTVTTPYCYQPLLLPHLTVTFLAWRQMARMSCQNFSVELLRSRNKSWVNF